MYIFKDYYQNSIELSFNDHPFSTNPRHVWVICSYQNDWVLTRHIRRGYEFPGGKVEPGEDADAAAVREVYEETGGIVSALTYLGQYRVTSKEKIIVKNIYYATLSSLEVRDHYYETKGPTLFSTLPANIKCDEKYSFIMKDDVLPYSLKRLKEMKMELK